MLFYVDEISERIVYVLDFIFNDRGLRYDLTNDHQYFVSSQLDKVNLSEMQIDNCLQYVPADILLSENIKLLNVSKAEFRGVECLSFGKNVDVLASIFYVLSRYEEYGEIEGDIHGRVTSKDSILSKFNWLNKLMCERWSIAFLDFLSEHFEINYQAIDSKFVASFDIDNAFAYKNRDGVRLIGSKVRDLLKGDRKRITERKNVNSGQLKDPYDTFDYIKSLKNRVDDVKVFWLLGDYSNYNKNIRYTHPVQARLIRQLSEYLIVGIHPGYESWSNKRILEEQLKRLKTILNKNVAISRQHFLRFRLPGTYLNLLNSGIKGDYSMGFSDAIGFRSGTARAYPFFDLKKNQITELMIFPFAYMDGTLKDYMKLSVDESILLTNQLIDEVKQFGGNFIPIWHNETIGDYGKWKGWSSVLEENIKYFYNE